jgi:lipopolysaccharide export system protein LptA
VGNNNGMSRKIYLNTFVLSLLILFTGSVYPQDDENIVVLDQADTLLKAEINGEEVNRLIGNVRMHQGKTMITCASATQYVAKNIVDLDGVVEIRDDTMRIVGMRGRYYGNEKIAEAFDRVMLQDPQTALNASYGKYFINEKHAYFKGNVYIEDSASIVTADEVHYYRDEGKSIAEGKVKIVNPTNRLTIFGNHFENYKKKKYSKVTLDPMVVQVDVNSKGGHDTLFVKALLLESYRDSVERLIATDSVKIFRSDLAAEAGSCVYYTGLDSIELRKDPFVWYQTGQFQDNQVSGESIFIALEKRQVKTVYVHDRAVAISRADTLLTKRFNQMTGKTIILHFTEDKINQINVITTATVLYYLFDKKIPNGLNITTGDEIIITFQDGTIDRIKGISGIEGKYHPERLVFGKESDYNLPEFNWREPRPQRYHDPRID